MLPKNVHLSNDLVIVHYYFYRDAFLSRASALYVPSPKNVVTEYQIIREVIW